LRPLALLLLLARLPPLAPLLLLPLLPALLLRRTLHALKQWVHCLEPCFLLLLLLRAIARLASILSIAGV
jgi:hypothetical protein